MTGPAEFCITTLKSQFRGISNLITIDEYLDVAIFHTARSFTRQDFIDFMYSQSMPHEDTITVARELARDARYTLMTLNNESEELNVHRIEKFGISEIFE